MAFEDIDVEKPAYLSKGHTILVYPPRPSHHVKSMWVNFTLEMPIHLRYHRPSVDNNSAHMSLQVPYVLLRCSGTTSSALRKPKDKNGAEVLIYHAPCNGTNETSCVWQLLPQEHMDKELQFEVPVGQQEHTLIVTIVTVLTTAFCVVILLVAMTRSAKDKPD